MKKKYIYIALLFVVTLVFGLSGCSTKKNTWTRRNYHNLAAHYNAYFNGNEALKTAKKDISLVHVDDYSEVLDVFRLATDAEAAVAIPNLERSIQKASLVIHKHSMFFNKKENVRWVYHSYMMVGKSHFYKHDYLMAQQSFQFVASRYKNEEVRWDAMMWQALTNIQEEEFDEARTQLDAVQNKANQGRVSTHVEELLPIVYAELFVKQKNYSAAVKPLEKAIATRPKKDMRSRLYFILGQIHQHLEHGAEAVDAYQKCIKLNPVYQMDFNARINMAKNFNAKEGGSREIKKELMKMLKDPKNKEFQDQIYFALAEIELKEKNRSEAKNYLRESVKTSVSNNKQKAFSSLQLADMLFEEKSYQNAQAYYDSTVMFMPKTYPGYAQLKEKNTILTELVAHLITIQSQDSLQRIAKMSEGQRNKLIQNLIAAEIERERAEAEAERIRKQNMMNALMDKNEMQSVTSKGSAKWYFYNSNNVSKGIATFQNKWNGRPLEDNWRISNKESLSFGEDSEEMDNVENKDSLKEVSLKERKTPEFYLKNIPLTKEMMDSSNLMIENAFFKLGLIYKEKLLNYSKSIDSFEDLLKRFEKTEHRPESYYYLYQNYNVKDAAYDAKYYKDLLIKDFPDSDYAKILSDPDYYKKLQKESDKAKDYYKEVYGQYGQGKYKEVYKNAGNAMKTLEMSNNQEAQFAILQALAVGKTSDTTSFIGALEKVSGAYSETEAGELAVAITNRLREGMRSAKNNEVEAGKENGKEGSGAKTNSIIEEETIYVFNKKENHMFLCIVDISKQNLNNYKKTIDNHNSTYFAAENLKVSSIPLNRNLIMIGVSTFPSKKKSLDYSNTLKHNKLLYGYLLKTGGNFFSISDGNYARLYKSKDIEGYKKFFKRYYK